MKHHSKQTDTSINAIRAAASYSDLHEASAQAYQDNDMVRRLTRGVMAALVGCHWLDENDLANAFSEVMAHVKDAIIENISNIMVQDVAAIEHASRTWRPGQDAQADDAQTPRKHQMIADLKDIVAFIESAEGETLEAFRRYVETHQLSANDGTLTFDEKYGIATARAVMADEALADVLDPEERRLIAHHRALKVYNNVSAGLRPDGTPDTDSDTDIDTDTAADVEPAIVRKVYPDTYSKFADVIEGFMAGADTERAEMLAMMARYTQEAAAMPDTDTAAE